MNWTHKRTGDDVLSVRAEGSARPDFIVYVALDRNVSPLRVARVGVIGLRPDAHGDDREHWADHLLGTIRVDCDAFARTGVLRGEFSLTANVVTRHSPVDRGEPVAITGNFRWDPATSASLTEVCTASDFDDAADPAAATVAPADATGTLDLQFSGDGWQDASEKHDYTLWIHSDDPAVAAHIPPKIANEGRTIHFAHGHCVVDAVPIGTRFTIYADRRTAYLLDDGDGPTHAGETRKVELVWLPWPEELQQHRDATFRMTTGRLLDDAGETLDATSLSAWVFNPIAGTPLTRWHAQAWSEDTTTQLHGDTDGTFWFDLGVMDGRPHPGELVLGLRDAKRGMPWVLRRKLTPEEDFDGAKLGDLRMDRTKEVVAGVVVDGGGAPVPNAFVWVEIDGPCLEKWESGYPLTVPSGCIRGSADAQGRFELLGISEAARFRCYAVAGGEGHPIAAHQLHDQHPTVATKGTSGLKVALSE